MIALVAIFTILLFANQTTFGSYIQALSVMAVLLIALYALFSRRIRLFRPNPTGLFWILAVIMPIQSAIVGALRGTPYQVLYAGTFMAFVWCSRIISMHFGPKKIVNAYLWGAVAMTLINLTIALPDLANALSLVIGRDGQFRFAPFNTHPNLIGHIFGLAAVISGVKFFLSKRISERVILATVCFFSFLFVLAASSRGGLFAAGISLAITLFLLGRDRFKWSISRLMVVALAGLIGSSAMIWLSDFDILGYLSDILELNSSYRGLDTGLTGRIIGWPIVLDRISQDIWSTFFGFGFRSWEFFTISGIAIDNSYIELAHDFGYPLAFIFVILLMRASRQIYTQRNWNMNAYVLLSIILFALSESVVTRYLLGIGNPASLLILLVLTSLSNNDPSTEIRKTYRAMKANEVGLKRYGTP